MGQEIVMTALDLAVIVVTRDHESYLPELFNSIECIFPKCVDLVVVDVGSLDSTLSVAKSGTTQMGRHVRIIEIARESTALDALAAAAPFVNSQYVSMISGDDYFSSNYFSAVKNALSERDCPCVLNFSLDLVDPDGKSLGRRNPSWKSSVKQRRQQLLMGNPGTAPGAVLPWSLLKVSGAWEGHPSILTEDYWLWWVLADDATFINVSEASVFYRRHSSSITGGQVDSRYVYALGYCVGEAYARTESPREKVLHLLLFLRWLRRVPPRKFGVYVRSYLSRVNR
jgi:glycosyltransferase involved in cell wall biosynthesis